MRNAKSTAMTSTLRCLHVLELLAENPFELGVSDLASILKTPKASGHRACATLLEAGFVERDPVTRRYRLSPKSLWIGSGYFRHSAVYRAAFFPMQDLAKHVPGPYNSESSKTAMSCSFIPSVVRDRARRSRMWDCGVRSMRRHRASSSSWRCLPVR